MARRRVEGWRDQAAADLLVQHLPLQEGSGSALVMGDSLSTVSHAYVSAGLSVTSWNRRALGGRDASPWPSGGPFSLVALRLPRAKEELRMSLHAATSVLSPGGMLVVYGAKDEGIQAAPKLMDEVSERIETLGVGGRCRVLRGYRRAGDSWVRGTLEDWKSRVVLNYPHLPDMWVSYPGVFAHGRLDQGTRLLLDTLPSIPGGSRVLDYGCGSGVIGYVARARNRDVRLELLDVDAVALEAARENVPGAELCLCDGLSPGERLPSGERLSPDREGLFDLVLSNPPFHRGKAEESAMLLAFLQGVPPILRDGGRLVMVTHRRMQIESALERSFSTVNVLDEDSVFRVWVGQGPLK